MFSAQTKICLEITNKKEHSMTILKLGNETVDGAVFDPDGSGIYRTIRRAQFLGPIRAWWYFYTVDPVHDFTPMHVLQTQFVKVVEYNPYNKAKPKASFAYPDGARLKDLIKEVSKYKRMTLQITSTDDFKVWVMN